MRLRLISEFQDGQKPEKWFTDFKASPDTWYTSTGAVPFIYNPDGELHLSNNHNHTHYQIIDANDDYYHDEYAEAYFDQAGNMDWDKEIFRIEVLPQYALLGRIGPKTNDDLRYVAFWSEGMELTEKLVPSCLKELIRLDLLTPDDIIIDDDRHMYVMDYLRGGRFKYSPEAMERKRKMQELHLMRPNQKKQAMRELGLDSASRKQPWQKAAEQNKIISPGQKWWAMQSESR